MSQLYYNNVVTDLASCETINENINYLRRVDDKRLDDDKWQEILEDAADKLGTSVNIILSCLEMPDDTDFKAYIKEKTVNADIQDTTEFDTTRIITLSTIHITKNTARLLDNEPDANTLELTVYKKAGYGWFIYITNHVKTDILNNITSLPEDLKLCLKTAIDNNCEWLCLDCDGPKYDKLPKYNW